MARVLVTAFRPFDHWPENASWLALQELTRDLPTCAEVVTRLYPVDYAEARSRLAADLGSGFDLAIHLGQAAGASRVQLEQFALNVRRDRGGPADAALLEPDGPAAYRSVLPLGEWADRLRSAGLPAGLSLHAGDYLCNALLYWSHHLASLHDPVAKKPHAAVFIHLPLDVSQAAAAPDPTPSLPAEQSAMAVRLLIEWGVAAVASQEPAEPQAGGIA